MARRGGITVWGLLALALCAGQARGQTPGWVQRVVTGPANRFNFSMAFDSARARTVLFGGVSGPPETHFGDTWEWDGTTWLQKSTTGPIPRYGPVIVFDSARALTVLFAGHIDSPLRVPVQDTWEWAGTAWTMRANDGPMPRSNHAGAFDSARGRMVVFGGLDHEGIFQNDTWEWDGTTWVQTALTGPTPPGRYIHVMAYDSARGRTVMFGGNDGSVDIGDTWEYDGSTWTQRLVSGPSARSAAAMVYDSARGVCVLFAGNGSSETWEWDGSAWRKRSIFGPDARVYHSMAYDSVRGQTVLFGGFTGSQYLADTWEYRGVSVGDMNQDGKVDGRDIQPFIFAMLNQPFNNNNIYLGDFSGNFRVDVNDVPEFVAALLGP